MGSVNVCNNYDNRGVNVTCFDVRTIGYNGLVQVLYDNEWRYVCSEVNQILSEFSIGIIYFLIKFIQGLTAQ